MELNKILCGEYEIYAHITEGKEAETLQQHIERCKKYLERLLMAKKLDCIVETFLREYMETDSQMSMELARKIWKRMITFHDVGKINPEFQRKKMGRKDFRFDYLKCLSGANHSFFSSIIYLDYCYDEIAKSKVEKKEARKLKMLAYSCAYLISRHHSDLGNMEDYERQFMDGGQARIIAELLEECDFPVYKGLFYFNADNIGYVQRAGKIVNKFSRDLKISYYTIMRLLYSILVSVDYYATSEYVNGVEIKNFGDISDGAQLSRIYESCELVQSIREYESASYGNSDIGDITDMNNLRNEMFLDAEKCWKEKCRESLFFLEAPTGSGKSNVAMNLSFQMQKMGQNKIFYVYPFNTLVEQNLNGLKEIFGASEEVFSKITVINSVTPIKTEQNEIREKEEDDYAFYQKALLDRQFLNYPFILTTHINLFDILFGNHRESIFGFLQLVNSIIILDEIQSYRNQIWSEIINFLTVMAKLMQIKVVIMSATLPDLEYLTDGKKDVIRLIKNRNKYFEHPVFCQRVKISYELLERNIDLEELYHHIITYTTEDKGILVEFIKKDTAYQFFELLYSKQQDYLSDRQIYLLTGDDNIIERTKILKKIKIKRNGVVLIATQVVEAGVDLDLDVGYKDISKLDSEEQFLGRINRSCKRTGVVYFFDLDSAEKIYKNDIRKNEEFILKNSIIQDILMKKSFDKYYKMILDVLINQFNESLGEEGIAYFFDQIVAKGKFADVSERMKLIEENDWNISIYLSRSIVLEDGTEIDGWECWNKYRELLVDSKMNYAKKQILLSEVRRKMNYFIYEIKKNSNLIYSDRIGELYAIQDGEKYFENGKLNKKMLEKDGGAFIEI